MKVSLPKELDTISVPVLFVIAKGNTVNISNG